jgi:hypothetical protein
MEIIPDIDFKPSEVPHGIQHIDDAHKHDFYNKPKQHK